MRAHDPMPSSQAPAEAGREHTAAPKTAQPTQGTEATLRAVALSMTLPLLLVGCASTSLQTAGADSADAAPSKSAGAATPLAQAALPTLKPRTDPVADLQRIAAEGVEDPERGPGQTQIGRYTSQDALPPVSAAEPLEVYAQLNFPRGTVRTIGDAIRYVLVRTGYRLVDETRLGAYEREFLALPLPENQRAIGPYQVRTILHTLLGPAWQLRRDPITRDLWFTVSDSHLALIEGRRSTAQAAQELTQPAPMAPTAPTAPHQFTVPATPAAVPATSVVAKPIAAAPRPVMLIAPPPPQAQPRLLTAPPPPAPSTAAVPTPLTTPSGVLTAAAQPPKVVAKPPPPQVGPAAAFVPATVATLAPKPTPVPGAAPLLVKPEPSTETADR